MHGVQSPLLVASASTTATIQKQLHVGIAYQVSVACKDKATGDFSHYSPARQFTVTTNRLVLFPQCD